jgi:hypothetical protein
VLSNCVAVNNHADRWGGGVYCYEGGEVFGCVLSSNYATWGGGVRCYLGGLVNRCIVQGNVAGNGAGVQIQYRGNVRSSLVAGNAGNLGGGVNLNYGGAMENCTVCDNTATTAGGGLYCNNGGSNVNSIVYYNLSPSDPNCFNADDEPYHMHCNTTPAITGTVAGPLIITNAPQFVDRGQGDYRVLVSSPCIDAGTNMPWMIGAKDLDGNERMYDGVVDIGAYEWVPEPCGGIAAVFALLCAVRRSTR